jgi:hypothetical protein
VVKFNFLCEIWGFHDGEDDDDVHDRFRRRVDSSVDANVTEKHTVSIFRAEDGDTAPKPRRRTSSFNFLCWIDMNNKLNYWQMTVDLTRFFHLHSQTVNKCRPERPIFFCAGYIVSSGEKLNSQWLCVLVFQAAKCRVVYIIAGYWYTTSTLTRSRAVAKK